MSEIRVGLIGGSGLGDALLQQTQGRRHEVQTPFGPPSDAIVETQWAGLSVFCLSRHGPGHRFHPSQIPNRANLFALKELGVTHIIASGAVGSLREEFKPTELVIPDQIIDKTYRRPGTFFEKAAVHVEFAEPFCPVVRRILTETGRQISQDAGAGNAMTVHERGCYVCMEGPAFSTRAESLMHRLWGGDLIGMTAMPEAKLAREAEIGYALVALVTDFDSWRQKPDLPGQDPAALLKEIIGNLQTATANAVRLIRRAVEQMADHRDELAASPARRALQLAIWSDKTKIESDEVRRLGPLWEQYFR